jgi:hypothetical protein
MVKILKCLAAVLCFCLAFSVFGSSGYAQSKKKAKDEPEQISREQAFYDPSFGAYIVPLKKVDGKLIPTSQEDYLNELENVETIDESVLFQEPTTGDIGTEDNYYEYYKYSPFETLQKVEGSRKKVSAELQCTTATCTISKTYTTSVSASYSVSLPIEINAIKANAGFTWVSSASDTSTYSFSLVKGDYGYVAFVPYYKKTRGYLRKYSNWDGLLSEKIASGYSVIKTSSGEADGRYVFVYLN